MEDFWIDFLTFIYMVATTKQQIILLFSILMKLVKMTKNLKAVPK